MEFVCHCRVSTLHSHLYNLFFLIPVVYWADIKNLYFFFFWQLEASSSKFCELKLSCGGQRNFPLDSHWWSNKKGGCCCCSVTQSCPTLYSATPWTAAHQASLSCTISWSLFKFMSVELVMPSSHLTICHSLLRMPSIFPSIRVFFNASTLCIRWPKYWSFSFSISPSNEYSRLISFRIDWFDLLALQETLKSLLQHHSSKASILQCLAFFMVQLCVRCWFWTWETSLVCSVSFLGVVFLYLLS